MALSGSFVGAASSSRPGMFYRLRVDWSATQSVANNTSTITCNFYLEQDNSWSISIGGRSNTCTIDGTTIGWTSPTVSNGGGTTTHIGSCSRTVSHNADGTKTLTISATYNTAPLTISNTAINSITASATVTLDTIARASTPTVSTSSVAMRDGSVTIYTNRASAGFTHALYYVCGSASNTIATGVTDSYKWTPPLDLAYQVPSDDEVPVTIYCDTYTDSGTTLVGTKPVNLTATVPANVTPYAEILNRGDATAAYVTLGTYVQNVSRLNLHIGNSGTYGSYVTGVGITLGGKAFSSGALITGSGNLTLRITVTDSRGRSSSDEEIVSVAPYKEPQLTLTAHRCDANGTANDAGEYAKISVSGSTTQVNNRNTAKCELTLGSGKPVDLGIGIGSFSKEQIVAVSSEETLAISATLSDSLSKLLKPATRSMVLSTGYATMDFLAGGRGIAFGTTATKEGFTCSMDTDFKGKKVAGVPAPVDASDATNKAYVDGLDSAMKAYAVSKAKMAFYQTDANGNHSLSGISAYPTTAGVFRVISKVTGLPDDVNGYGTLVIFDGGSYILHLYLDASGLLYYARTADGVAVPTSWKVCGGKRCIWTNPSPSADFARQNVVRDLSEYNFVSIKFAFHKTLTDSLYCWWERCPIGEMGAATFTSIGGTSYPVTVRRTFYATENGIQFSTGAYHQGTVYNESDASRAIPLAIYVE